MAYLLNIYSFNDYSQWAQTAAFIISTPFYLCMVFPLLARTTCLEVKLSLYSTQTHMQRAEVQLH
jgi:hypothetical protein